VKPCHWAREASGAALSAVRSTSCGARSTARAVTVMLQQALHHGTLHSASPSALRCQLAAFSFQPSAFSLVDQPTRRTLGRHGRALFVRRRSVLAYRTTIVAQFITRNLDGDAPRDPARRRTRPQPQPARHHRPLPAVARRRRRARPVVPLHPQGPYDAAEPPPPERRSCSSQAVRGVRPHRRHKHGRVGGRHDCSAARLG
jgi:hypothetical protein